MVYLLLVNIYYYIIIILYDNLYIPKLPDKVCSKKRLDIWRYVKIIFNNKLLLQILILIDLCIFLNIII
jgi:hypothetical protein